MLVIRHSNTPTGRGCCRCPQRFLQLLFLYNFDNMGISKMVNIRLRAGVPTGINFQKPTAMAIPTPTFATTSTTGFMVTRCRRHRASDSLFTPLQLAECATIANGEQIFSVNSSVHKEQRLFRSNKGERRGGCSTVNPPITTGRLYSSVVKVANDPIGNAYEVLAFYPSEICAKTGTSQLGNSNKQRHFHLLCPGKSGWPLQ